MVFKDCLPQISRLALHCNGAGRECCTAIGMMIQDPQCKLAELDIAYWNIDDESAIILANGLKANTSLIELALIQSNVITDKGWHSISLALCDTSSINATYTSNHTIKQIHLPSGHNPTSGSGEALVHFLIEEMNDSNNKKLTAKKKILYYHNQNLDMHLLFEWDMKALPYVTKWFDEYEDKAKEADASNAQNRQQWKDAEEEWSRANEVSDLAGEVYARAEEKYDAHANTCPICTFISETPHWGMEGTKEQSECGQSAQVIKEHHDAGKALQHAEDIYEHACEPLSRAEEVLNELDDQMQHEPKRWYPVHYEHVKLSCVYQFVRAMPLMAIPQSSKNTVSIKV